MHYGDMPDDGMMMPMGRGRGGYRGRGRGRGFYGYPMYFDMMGGKGMRGGGYGPPMVYRGGYRRGGRGRGRGGYDDRGSSRNRKVNIVLIFDSILLVFSI